jgi:putative photosynthetic complex assembly protein
MSTAFNAQRKPLTPLILAGLLILSSMILAGVAHHTDFGASRLKAPDFVRFVDVRFEDLATGQIRIVDVNGQLPPRIFDPGKDDFVRVATRSLLRDRAAVSAAADAPIRIGLDGGGRLWLRDLATRRLLLLDAYGYANRASFARIIEPTGASS